MCFNNDVPSKNNIKNTILNVLVEQTLKPILANVILITSWLSVLEKSIILSYSSNFAWLIYTINLYFYNQCNPHYFKNMNLSHNMLLEQCKILFNLFIHLWYPYGPVGWQNSVTKTDKIHNHYQCWIDSTFCKTNCVDLVWGQLRPGKEFSNKIFRQ